MQSTCNMKFLRKIQFVTLKIQFEVHYIMTVIPIPYIRLKIYLFRWNKIFSKHNYFKFQVIIDIHESEFQSTLRIKS